jgi:RNase P subunit p30
MISNAQNLVRALRGKNVILSSAAEREFDVRTPYDLANLSVAHSCAAASRPDVMALCLLLQSDRVWDGGWGRKAGADGPPARRPSPCR